MLVVKPRTIERIEEFLNIMRLSAPELDGRTINDGMLFHRRSAHPVSILSLSIILPFSEEKLKN